MTNSLFSLKGKRALVTGSTRGIGREILLTLARAGAEVVVHGIEKSAVADDFLEECRKAGVPASFVPGDLSLPNGGRSFGETVLREVGPVDIVVLNASIQIRKPWREISAAEGEVQMQTNLLASLEILQTFVPSMQAKKWGRIVSIGSVQETKPHPEMLMYSASKAAQTNMIRSLARQLAGDGITVNNLAPGVILTDRNVSALADPAYAKAVKAAIPVGFFGEASDCAGAALLLCSDAGRYITGQSLCVDGGMSL